MRALFVGFSLLFFSCISIAQNDFRIGIGGQTGVGILKTAYNDRVSIGSNLPEERESIFSKVLFKISPKSTKINQNRLKLTLCRREAAP